MNVVLSWLQDHCRWEWPVEELIERLTQAGVEVEGVRRTGCAIENIVAARVLEYGKHPNADRLRLCRVDDGSGTPRRIVCGASNFEAGDTVPLALPGAVMPSGLVIKAAKLRGEMSEGMMCSGAELGIPQESDGLLILPEDALPGTPLTRLFPGETVLEIEVTPNRADLLSYRGLARELVAQGAEPCQPKLPAPLAMAARGPWAVAVEDAEDCPRYTACLFEGVKVGPAPDWMRQRLEAQGLRPINNVVDLTNYVLFDTGQPLHAFDADRLSGGEIRVRRARAGEKFLALDGKTHVLEAGDLVIADGRGPVALAGVMGGEATGVTAATTRVLLESARFDRVSVRRTSRRLGLMSDSSYRFERGIDPAAVDLGVAQAGGLLQQWAAAKFAGPGVQSSPPEVPERQVELRPGAVKKLLGFDPGPERVEQILTGLGLRERGGVWSVPSYRPDLEREVDLIEEVARIAGLDGVAAELPPGVAMRAPADRAYNWEGRLRRRLAGLGFYEMKTTTFVAGAAAEAGAVKLLNPLNEEATHLRAGLLATLLPCIAHNVARGREQVAAFEIGDVYRLEGGRAVQERRLALVWTGRAGALHWSASEREADYYDLKGAVEAVLALAPGWKGPESWGLVPRERCAAAGLKQKIWAAEWPLPETAAVPAAKFEELPVYPAVKRDLALVVKRSVAAAEVEGALRAAGVGALERVDCFDIFTDDTGAKLPADEKSLAYALTFRDPGKTLGESDVAGFEKKLLASAESRVGAKLRR